MPHHASDVPIILHHSTIKELFWLKKLTLETGPRFNKILRQFVDVTPMLKDRRYDNDL